MNIMKRFNNKEEYLDWRNEWKKGYLKCSQKIRDLRWLVKEQQRYYSKALKEIKRPSFNFYSEIYKKIDEYKTERYKEIFNNHFSSEKFCNVVGTWLSYREVAKDMIDSLKEAKIEANIQYLESKKNN